MIRTLLALAVVTLATACVAAPTVPIGPAAIAAAKQAVPAASPPPSPASLNDLSGVWVIAAAGKPLAGGPVAACDLQQVLVLKQHGDRVSTFRAWFGYAGEIPLEGDSETTEGEIVGSQLVRTRGTHADMDGTTSDVVYDLRFDVTTLHLKGTRNGEAFEAAQLLCPQLGRPEFRPVL